MFEQMEDSSNNVIGIKVKGKLLDKDYEELNQWLDDIKKNHDDIYMLCFLEDFHGWGELSAVWDDFKLGMNHRKDIKRCAMVGDKTWQKWGTTLGDWFMQGEVKYFDHAELEKAWEWVKP